MKKIICFVFALLMITMSFVACEKKHVAPKHEDLDFSEVDISQLTVTDEETDYVIITVENYGQIAVRLFPDVAPETVKNFKSLVADEFYDGLIFHRVIEGFMIQGGGYDAAMKSKNSDSIKGEFTNNGFENNLLHVRGVISMARTSEPNSASSQFFIMHKDYPSLNGEYAAFGVTVYGLDVVDKIATVRTNSSDAPRDDIIITSVRFAEKAE